MLTLLWPLHSSPRPAGPLQPGPSPADSLSRAEPDLSKAKTIPGTTELWWESCKSTELLSQGTARECPCLAVLPRGHLSAWSCQKSATHPFPGDTSTILLTHRDTGLAEPRAGGAKTHQGLHPRQPGKMLALELLSHPATLGGLGSSGKPPHDGMTANSDKGTSCGTTPARWHTAEQDAAPIPHIPQAAGPARYT